jgi:hypothetical protein
LVTTLSGWTLPSPSIRAPAAAGASFNRVMGVP